MLYTDQEIQEHFKQETQRRPAQAVWYPSLDDYDNGVVEKDQLYDEDILD